MSERYLERCLLDLFQMCSRSRNRSKQVWFASITYTIWSICEALANRLWSICWTAVLRRDTFLISFRPGMKYWSGGRQPVHGMRISCPTGSLFRSQPPQERRQLYSTTGRPRGGDKIFISRPAATGARTFVFRSRSPQGRRQDFHSAASRPRSDDKIFISQQAAPGATTIL